MLQAIRDRATGWIAWAIVILISLTFAFWGVGEYLTPDPNVTVASVNGKDIGYQRFQQAYGRQQARLRAMLGAAWSPELVDEEMLRRRTLDSLVRDELLVQSGIDDGMRIGDAQLAGAIQSQRVFQLDGLFSQDRYGGWLASQGYSPGAFEFDLRRSLLTEQLSAGIAASEFATAREADTVARLEGQQRTVSTLTVHVDVAQLDEVGDADARAYFDAHRGDFVADETLDVEFVLLSRNEVAGEIEVDEETLRAVYEARKDQLGRPEQREASHILVAIGRDGDEAAVEAARAKVEALSARIEGGESFEDVARDNSDDPGSAAQGGALPGFSRGVMDPAFEEAAFSQEIDVVGAPVRSAFGFHLIKVTAIAPGGAEPFDEVRAQLALDYQQEQAEQIFFERMERLANLAFENPTSLGPAADALAIEVQSTGPGTRVQGHELLSNKAVWQAALIPEVLDDGVNSELVELDPDRVAIIRVVEHVPSAQHEFDEVRAQVVAAVQAERAAEVARAAGEAMLERLALGEDAAVLADELVERFGGDAWSEARVIGRRAFDLDAQIVEAAFRAARPRDGAPVFDGVDLGDGDYALIAVSAVEDPAAGEGDEPLRRRATAGLAVDLGQRGYGAVVETLREQADVVLDTAEVELQ